MRGPPLPPFTLLTLGSPVFLLKIMKLYGRVTTQDMDTLLPGLAIGPVPMILSFTMTLISRQHPLAGSFRVLETGRGGAALSISFSLLPFFFFFFLFFPIISLFLSFSDLVRYAPDGASLILSYRENLTPTVVVILVPLSLPPPPAPPLDN